MRVKDDNGYADFAYVCCYKSPDGDVTCKDLEDDEWMTTLKIFIEIIGYVVLFYAPSFIPGNLYSFYFIDSEYIYPLAGEKHIRFVVTKDPGNYKMERKVVRLSTVPGMKDFKTCVCKLAKEDSVYQLTVNKAQLKIRDRKTLGKNDVPVGLGWIIYDILFCRIRHLWPFKDCCNTNLCPSKKASVSWYKCGLSVAKIVLVLSLMSPWFIRLGVFYSYEVEPKAAKEEKAGRLGLALKSTDSIISFLYSRPGLAVISVILVLDVILDAVMDNATKKTLKDYLRQSLKTIPPYVGLLRFLKNIDPFCFISSDVKAKVNNIMQKCKHEMRDLSTSEVCSLSASLVILPFLRCGVLGFLVFPFYFVILVAMLLLLFIPLLKLTSGCVFVIFMQLAMLCIRQPDLQSLLLDLYKITSNEDLEQKKQLTFKDKSKHIFLCIMYLATFWTFSFLVMDVISFYVKMALYTLMGIIINATIVLELVTVVFMLVMYGRSTLKSVRDKYLPYHQQIHKELLARKKETIDDMAEALEEEKFALDVQNEPAESPEPTSFIVKSGIPYWETSSLLLFLDKRDTYTPEKFFYKTIGLDYCGAPGPLHVTLMEAARKFGYVLVSLLFVFVVVVAFTNAYSFSPTKLLLATMAGGFLLFLFRDVFKSPKPPSLQTDSIQFKSQFHKAIEDYKQKWPVYDFDCTQVSPADATGERESPQPVSEQESGYLDMIIHVSTIESVGPVSDEDDLEQIIDN